MEAMDVCCGQLDDPQLALFLGLLLEHQEQHRVDGGRPVTIGTHSSGPVTTTGPDTTTGPGTQQQTASSQTDQSPQQSPQRSSSYRESAAGLRFSVLEKKVLPIAVKANDAWFHSLVLWLLGRYEEAVVATLPRAILAQLGDAFEFLSMKHLDESGERKSE